MGGSLFSKKIEDLKESLRKSRDVFSNGLARILEGSKDKGQLIVQIEELLLGADIGVRTTSEIIDAVNASRAPISEDVVKSAIKDEIEKILSSATSPVCDDQTTPHVVMVVGVNGTGKTTTIAKLAYRYKIEGKSVLLAASDTFRAAAIEQLEVWARRAGVGVVKHKPGADAASVAYDACEAAKARAIDALIIDTAGRLQTKKNLMQEVSKIGRVVGKVVEGAPHEVLLVLDATTGQNAISQARAFSSACGVTGIVIAKIDGTAKGGIVVAIAKELGIPILYMGTGESLEDLEPFDAILFAEALLG